MPIRLLGTADIHLGRRPTRVPDEVDAHQLGPGEAWRRLVDEALRRRVDAVLIAGDAVDADNRFFEAYRALADGVDRLLDGGVPVYAVAGNHDHDVLARLADQFDGFHLLGRGGQWEVAELASAPSTTDPSRSTIGGADESTKPPTPRTRCRLVGWSFPSTHVINNPLDQMPALDGETPTVGLLHCDVDATGSRYAPVRLGELTARPVAAWLLGHTHAPRLLSQSPPVLYPGSLQGLDPGEPGRRGAWLLTLGDGPARFEPIPLAALRYEPITVDLTEHPPTDPLDARMAGALREHVESIRDELGPTRAIACRVTFTGRVPVALRRRLAAESATMLDQPPLPLNRLECFIESVDDQTAPALPLEELRRSRDPLGLLARKVLMLERREPDGEYRELIRAAGQTIGHARAAGAFAPLRAASTEPDEATVRDHLLRAARALLDELHAQKPADVSYAAHREQGEGDA